MSRKQATNRLNRILPVPVLLAGISACGVSDLQKPPAFNPAEVDAIRVRVEEKSVFGVPVARPEVGEKIAENLSGWGYKVSAGDELSAGHELSVEVGEVEHASTPVGFSFSAGNSDPRSLDFQKSDVLSITCTLMPKEQPQNRAELSMGFPAGDYQNRSAADAERAQLITLLENDISTVCFNLLSELDVPVRQEEGVMPVGKPSWIPEIRLEIENEAQPNPDSAVDGATDSGQPTNAPNTAPKKRIIIHNQGSPVIFKFGHERK